MKTVLRSVTIAAVLALSACAIDQPVLAQSVSTDTAVLSFADLPDMGGEGWTGTLDYLDYSSRKRTSIAVDVSISAIKPRRVDYAIRFPGESQYNSREAMRLSRNGKTLNGERVLSSSALPGGGMQIVTLEIGPDDGKKADIRRTYRLGSDAFSISKDIDFGDGAGYFNRNVFSLTR